MEQLEKRLDHLDGGGDRVIPCGRGAAEPAASPRLQRRPDQVVAAHELEQRGSGLGVLVADVVNKADPEVEDGA